MRFGSGGDRSMLVHMDQSLLELAIRARGGELELAAVLHHDVPAIDWWRHAGVPAEMRGAVHALADERHEPPA
jgi:hypothetical protein